jgi:hypothetical protein
MTCKELYLKEHPNCDMNPIELVLNACPTHFGYLEIPKECKSDEHSYTCDECWNREIPEDTLRELLKKEDGSEVGYGGYCHSIDTKAEDFKKVTDTDIANTWPDKPIILDSGTRREFETGAVRDIQEGKGRCDLMPLDVVAYFSDKVIDHIASFKKAGKVAHLYNAMERFMSQNFKTHYDAFIEVSKHFEEGAKKYGDNNWQKGIPVRCYIDSALRHYFKFKRGDCDEPHHRAFLWNLMCCIWTCIHKPELNDYAKKED